MRKLETCNEEGARSRLTDADRVAQRVTKLCSKFDGFWQILHRFPLRTWLTVFAKVQKQLSWMEGKKSFWELEWFWLWHRWPTLYASLTSDFSSKQPDRANILSRLMTCNQSSGQPKQIKNRNTETETISVWKTEFWPKPNHPTETVISAEMTLFLPKW